MSTSMNDIVHWLPHFNASLNAVATFLLLQGFILIKMGREGAHRRIMLACFGVSVVFLLSYLMYHAAAGSRRFPTYPPSVVRRFYFTVLISHVVLAALVPILALRTIYLGLTGRRAAHRRWAKWTFPIWLYVSVTGVIVYFMLYQLFPPQPEAAIICRLAAHWSM